MRRALTLGLGAGAAIVATSWVLAARLRRRGVRCSPLRYMLLRWQLRRTDDLLIVADFDRVPTPLTPLACCYASHSMLFGP